MNLLQEFEQWLKEEIEVNRFDNLGIALSMAQKKLEGLKEKYNVR